MSEAETCSSSSSGPAERRCTPDVLVSGRDGSFLRSLEEFIRQERRYLGCPDRGPDPLRVSVSRQAFNQVIGRASAYRKLLLAIKSEYDDVIAALQRSEHQVRTLSTSEPLATCHRRAAHLRDRIRVLQRETAELQQEKDRRESCEEQFSWIPGLALAESQDPEALDRHLQLLKAQRAALLAGAGGWVPLGAGAELEAELEATKQHRNMLSAQNHHHKVLFRRLRSVWDRLSSWEDQQQVPLEDLLGSTVENLRQGDGGDDDACSIDAELFEHEEPTGVDESRLLSEHLDRFTELFEEAQYEEAALLAATAPGGVLRNLSTLQLFTGVKAPTGSPSPLLLFLQALLTTVPSGEQLPAALSLQLVGSALRLSATQLVTHAINSNKLTLSEEVGNLLTEHAQKNAGAADVCLALATAANKASGHSRKTALSMCRRGLIHSAATLMRHSNDLTAEDCMWVLCRSPSLPLLRLLVAPQPGTAVLLPVGVACCALLADPQLGQLALQLLDGFVSRGPGALEEAILQDSSSVEVWTSVAALCSERDRADLSRAVRSVLLDQSGTGVLSPDLEGAQLMEHVFL